MEQSKADYLRRKLNEWNKAVTDLEKADIELDKYRRIKKQAAANEAIILKRKEDAQQRIDNVQDEIDGLTN